jgi:oxygen-dependent protoporphyrinogen oxidase
MAPARLWPILTSPLLSIPGRLRLCAEPLISEPVDGRDESLTEFATRRLGREGFERLVQPLVSGIYTADPDQLSVAAALPQMVDMVREHGSLYGAMRDRAKKQTESASTRGARYSLFVAPRGGMSDFTDAIASKLTATEIRRASRVERCVHLADGRWQLSVQHGTAPELFEGVIMALPHHVAADLLAESEAELSAELHAIPLASSAVVCLGVKLADVGRTLDAFGCVVPAAERRRILAVSYSSLKFPGRAPEGELLLRVFVGGALQAELAELPDEKLLELVRAELATLLKYRGTPRLEKIVRWPHAMPQYHLGHLDRVRRIESLVAHTPGLQLAGNALHGVGIPQCVHSGEVAADALCAELSGLLLN